MITAIDATIREDEVVRTRGCIPWGFNKTIYGFATHYIGKDKRKTCIDLSLMKVRAYVESGQT